MPIVKVVYDRVNVLEFLSQNRAAAAAASSLLSDSNSAGGLSSSAAGNGGGLFSLIDTSLSAAPANMPDPWSTIFPASSASLNTNNSSDCNVNTAPISATATSPFDTPAYNIPLQLNNTNSAVSDSSGGGNQLSLMESSPWTPKGEGCHY